MMLELLMWSWVAINLLMAAYLAYLGHVRTGHLYSLLFTIGAVWLAIVGITVGTKTGLALLGYPAMKDAAWPWVMQRTGLSVSSLFFLLAADCYNASNNGHAPVIGWLTSPLERWFGNHRYKNRSGKWSKENQF